MTTTLRPTEPERHGPGGHRARSYAVCVNSRPVGAVTLATDARFGPGAGRVLHLAIDEPDRRRGRATVAVLAAEEVLRGWGCRRVEASVPADAAGALRLAEALGYTERSRNMAKRVPDAAPALPEGTEGRPVDGPEFAAWLEAAKRSYARHWADRGVPEAEALAKSEADHAALLPDGLRTPGLVLRVLSHRGTDVGTLWTSLGNGVPKGLDGYVFDVEVAAGHRGRGHGRSLMLLAERECRAAGAALLGLHVFTDNTPALRLYESLGYRTTHRNLAKPLL